MGVPKSMAERARFSKRGLRMSALERRVEVHSNELDQGFLGADEGEVPLYIPEAVGLRTD